METTIKTLKQVLDKALKSTEFKEAYNEEIFRFKMATEIKNLRFQKK